MTYNDILLMCQTDKPSLIYLAVGCAQGFYTRDKSSPQEYPPFVVAWPGRKICILIDPELESPPYCFQNLGLQKEYHPVTHIGDTSFFCIRKRFETPPAIYGEDMHFLISLCTMACNSSSKLIYQDYSGRYTDNLFNLIMESSDREKLIKSVLFDATYKDSGCFIDFDKIRILRDNKGDFIQPAFETLTFLRLNGHLQFLAEEKKRRKMILGDYVHRYYQILIGGKEPRDWCTGEIILGRIKPMTEIYGTRHAIDVESIYDLLEAVLLDFCMCDELYLPENDMKIVIDAPDKYLETLTLCNI